MRTNRRWALGAAFACIASLPAGLAEAQRAVRIVVTEADSDVRSEGRAVVAGVAAELRSRHEARIIVDPRRTEGESFRACDTDRCRAGWIAARHASAVVALRLASSESAQDDESVAGPDDERPDRNGGDGAVGSTPSALRIEVRVFAEDGTERGEAREARIEVDATGSFRIGVADALRGVALPRPLTAPWTIACDVEGARVFVDDHPVGRVPLAPLRVVPGEHRLRILSDRFAPRALSVVVDERGTRTDVRLRRSGE